MEEWRDISGYEGLYQVSNFGRVKSFKNGEKILKTHASNRGYLRVALSKDGKTKHLGVHRIVATAFIENPDNKRTINHRDGDKTNNCVDNLSWCTQSENNQHAYDTGLSKSGEDHGRAKLSNEQVRYVRENSEGLTGVALAEKFGVTEKAISYIQLGKTYKTVDGRVREAKIKYTPHIPKETRDQIRAEYKLGVRGCGCHVLAKKYGVYHTTILRIIRENK